MSKNEVAIVKKPGRIRKAWDSLWGRDAVGISERGNIFSQFTMDTFFQRNLKPVCNEASAALQAAIAAHVAAFVLMQIQQKRALPSGGYETITQSPLMTWTHKPNGFQTIADFWAVGIRLLMEKGNAVAAAARDERGNVVATVWASYYSLLLDPETGSIFYRVSLNDGIEREDDFIIPARDVMHLRINAPVSDPMHGRSPIVWCAGSLSVNVQLTAFLNSYIANRASPSYALTTDAVLNEDQRNELRTSWDNQSRRLASGGVPILSSGLKPVQLGVAPGDELLISTFNLTVEDVARAFSMPRALLGISETAANASDLMKSWISLGLGSLAENVEQQVARLFGLPADQFCEFDHTALLRLDGEALIRMVSQGVTAGVLSPDEGRAIAGLPPIDGGYGKIPYAQQQMVPLSLLNALHEADIAARLPAPEAEEVDDEIVDDAPPGTDEEVDDEKDADPEIVKALVIQMREFKRKHAHAND